MTITQETEIRTQEANPCPPWCLSYECEYGHLSGCDHHEGAGRAVELTAEPPYTNRNGTILEERALLNAWQPFDGSDPHITLQFDSDGFNGHERHLTVSEARGLAAELLAAVGEVEGTNGRMGVHEMYVVNTLLDDHAKELQILRASQLERVVPTDGKVVEWCSHKAFFCKRCDAWVAVDFPLRNGQARRKHAELTHSEG